MMWPVRAVVAFGLAWGALVAVRVGAQQPTEPSAVRSELRFDGWVKLSGGDSAHVEIRQWRLTPHATVDSLPLSRPGQLIVHVGAGRVTTVIGGKRLLRREGHVWSVPAGVRLRVEGGPFDTVLETTLISRGG